MLGVGGLFEELWDARTALEPTHQWSSRYTATFVRNKSSRKRLHPLMPGLLQSGHGMAPGSQRSQVTIFRKIQADF